MRLFESASCLLGLALALAASGCSSSTTSNGGPVDGGSTADTGDDTAPAAAPYPDFATPPTFTAHTVFPNLTWKGYHDSTGPLVDIHMSDYYDPDGSKGITAIYFIVAAQWCGPCNAEATNAPKIYAESYKSRGARYVSVVIEDTAQKPATQATLDAWIKDHKLNYDMGVYPSNADHSSDVLPSAGNVGLPHNYIIDPRTMLIQSITQGVDPAVWACDMFTADPTLSTDGCCIAGTTKYSDGSDVCTADYSCVKGKVCLPPSDTNPSIAMEVVMKRNGAPPFGS